MLLPVAGQLFWKDHVRHRLIALVSSGQALVICPGKAPGRYRLVALERLLPRTSLSVSQEKVNLLIWKKIEYNKFHQPFF
jgi:hypothetical protein